MCEFYNILEVKDILHDSKEEDECRRETQPKLATCTKNWQYHLYKVETAPDVLLYLIKDTSLKKKHVQHEA